MTNLARIRRAYETAIANPISGEGTVLYATRERRPLLTAHQPRLGNSNVSFSLSGMEQRFVCELPEAVGLLGESEIKTIGNRDYFLMTFEYNDDNYLEVVMSWDEGDEDRRLQFCGMSVWHYRNNQSDDAFQRSWS